MRGPEEISFALDLDRRAAQKAMTIFDL